MAQYRQVPFPQFLGIVYTNGGFQLLVQRWIQFYVLHVRRACRRLTAQFQEPVTSFKSTVGTFFSFFFPQLLHFTMQLCEGCKKQPFKYKCPRCSFKSCSLDCSKTHKIRTGCSGERSKTHYVPLKQYTYSDMMSGKFAMRSILIKTIVLTLRTKTMDTWKICLDKRIHFLD